MGDETDSYVPRLWTLKEISARFQQLWLEQSSPSIERFLSDVPENKRTAYFHGLLKTELELRRKNRETPQQSDYVRRFPQYLEVISEAFAGSRPRPSSSTPLPAPEAKKVATPSRELPLQRTPTSIPQTESPPSSPGIPPGGRIEIQVIAGPRKGSKFSFDRHDTFLVGRSSKAHLQLTGDPHFSRFHFRLEFNPPQCYLIDLGSRNGTFVNGQQVEECHVQSGDIISCGLTELKIVLDSADQTLCLPTSPVSPIAVNPLSHSSLPEVTEAETSFELQSTFPLLDSRKSDRPRAAAASPDLPETVSDTPGDDRPRPAVSACPPLRLSQVHIPGYELQEELACGDLGVLYRAVQQSTNRTCALKVLQPAIALADKAFQTFQRECRIHHQLRHPHIVQFFDQGRAGNLLYIATEHLPAVRLSDHLRERRLSDRVRICGGLMAQVLSALEYAHGQGLVHRDIKPGNIVISKQDNKLNAKLSDFGLAKHYANAGFSRLTKAGDVIGSLPYMAPEQFLNSRDARPSADLYSAAATLYTWLTGRMPHEFPPGRSQFLVVLEDAPVPIEQRIPEISPNLATVIECALSKEPEDRFSSAAEMRQALKSAIQS